MHRIAALCALIFIVLPSAALAQTVEDRAGELKAWREQCSDPDPDLRLAYLEAAIATDDASIQRICVRQSLESDNADIRNLGLRAAMGAIDQLTFTVQIPPQLEKALKDAGSNEDKLDDIYRWYVYRDWAALRTGFVVAISDASIESAGSTWSPLVNLTKVDDDYEGKATIVGDHVTWVGSAYLSRRDCHLTLSLQTGPSLAGELQCGDIAPFPVSAKLL